MKDFGGRPLPSVLACKLVFKPIGLRKHLERRPIRCRRLSLPPLLCSQPRDAFSGTCAGLLGCMAFACSHRSSMDFPGSGREHSACFRAVPSKGRDAGGRAMNARGYEKPPMDLAFSAEQKLGPLRFDEAEGHRVSLERKAMAFLAYRAPASAPHFPDAIACRSLDASPCSSASRSRPDHRVSVESLTQDPGNLAQKLWRRSLARSMEHFEFPSWCSLLSQGKPLKQIDNRKPANQRPARQRHCGRVE